MDRKILPFVTALFILTAGLSVNTYAQPGYLDTSYYKCAGVDFKCTGGLILPDSSLMAIGRFAYVNDRYVRGVVKLTPAGEVDPAFNPGTGADEHVNQIIRQTDGKMILAGDFRTYNGDSVFHIVRINPDGSRDMTYNTGTGVTTIGTVYAACLQADGKVVLGGIFNTYNGDSAFYIVRLNTDGTRDTTFNTGAGFNNTVYSIEQQTDGKLIVAGNFTSYKNDTNIIRIVRLNLNGAVDPLFNAGLGANGIITRAKLQADGKIIAVGFFTTYNGTARSRITRINTDGSIDNTYNVGSGFNNNVNDIVIQADGKVIATGNFTRYNGTNLNRIVRINTNGSRDGSFYIGTGLNLSCNAVFLHPDQRIYVGGTFTSADVFARLRLTRLLNTGHVDSSFFNPSKMNNTARFTGTQSNGQLVVAGAFTRFNNLTVGCIARLTASGAIDTTFKSGTGANANIRSLKVLPNDKMLIAGDFTSYNGTTINRVARLNADGSLDTTFNPGSGANAVIYCMELDAQGRIYLGGNFAQFNGVAAAQIVRLSANGALDGTFSTGAGFNNYVHDMAIQPDGKVIAVGAFTTFQSATTNRIIRLNTDGTPDATFTTAGVGANNLVLTVEALANGDILIGGTFTRYNNTTKNRIAKLSPTGTLRTYSANIANGAVYDIATSGPNTLVGGTFTTVNSNGRNRFVALDSAGALNNNFYIGTGVNNGVFKIFIDSLQRSIYISGDFNEVQFHLASRVARLANTDLVLEEIETTLCPGAIAKVYFTKKKGFNPGNVFTVQLSDSLGKFTNPVNIGAGNNNTAGFDSITVYFPNNLANSSQYRVRILAVSPEEISNASQAITISAPQPVAINASGPLTFCPGASVTLTPALGTSFTWSNGATTASIQVTTSGSYHVTVNNNNCTSISNPVTVNVLSGPDSSIIYEAASLCGGGSVKLSGAPGYSYNWNLGVTGPSITVTQDGFYSLTVTDTSGCAADSSINLVLADFFNNLIMANGPTTICPNSSVTLSSIGGVNYQWSNGETTQSIQASTAGAYSVTISDGICSLNSGTINVSVLPATNVSFSLPQDTVCNNSGTIQLSGSPQGGTFSGSGVSGTAFSPSSLSNTTALVTYTYVDGNNCSYPITDSVFVLLCSSVDALSENRLHIYPNPTQQFLYLSLPEKHNNGTIEVTDIAGNRILTQVATAGNLQMLDVSHLAAGSYFVRFQYKKAGFVKLK